jgi:hypothetical protein
LTEYSERAQSLAVVNCHSMLERVFEKWRKKIDPELKSLVKTNALTGSAEPSPIWQQSLKALIASMARM